MLFLLGHMADATCSPQTDTLMVTSARLTEHAAAPIIGLHTESQEAAIPFHPVLFCWIIWVIVKGSASHIPVSKRKGSRSVCSNLFDSFGFDCVFIPFYSIGEHQGSTHLEQTKSILVHSILFHSTIVLYVNTPLGDRKSVV